MPPTTRTDHTSTKISDSEGTSVHNLNPRKSAASKEISGSAFEMLVRQCRLDPGFTRLSFLNDNADTDQSVTGHDLIARANWLAKQLFQSSRPGDRVLLAFPAGIDFVIAFLASVRAGLIPVPVPYPKPRRPFSRYASVAIDSGATLGLTNLETLKRSDQNASETNDGSTGMRWLSPSPWSQNADPVDTKMFDRPDPDVLFLQYTSGSTGTPKGVRVTMANLLANLDVIGRGFGLDRLERDRRIVCSWLPAYHDMGLVGIILSTLIHDGHAVLMSPTSFMQRPSRWLSAISDYQAAITVAPCFGYRYAAAKVSDEEIQSLNLSSLSVAACGAEPIDPAVLRQFADRFEPAGFQPSAFYPCYGLAESTLMVTGADRDPQTNRDRDHDLPGFDLPNFDLPGYDCKRISRQGVRESAARSPISDADTMELVSAGVAGKSTELRIVGVDSGIECGENQIGEIWVRSPSVADGYWNQPTSTAATFRGQITKQNPSTDQDRVADLDRFYLQTGDLGFLSDGQLYVTGRMKDLIIIRGQNHYPEDVERSVIESSIDLNECLGAAFSAPSGISGSGESLVFVQEVPRRYTAEQASELLGTIRLRIASEHDLIASSIVLIRFASMPRTSSGKVQRSQCRQQFLDDALKVIDQWQSSTRLDPTLFPDLTPLLDSPNASVAVQERIERVLMTWLIRQTGMDKHSMDAQRPFAECGIDSLMAVEMSGQLEQWLGIRLSPVVAWSHPNPEKLSKYLTGQLLGETSSQQETSKQNDAPEPSIEMLLAEIESMSESEIQSAIDDSK